MSVVVHNTEVEPYYSYARTHSLAQYSAPLSY